MRREHRAWTDDEMVALADAVAAGESTAAIAALLGRSAQAIESRRRRILCPIDGRVPRWGQRPYGDRLHWTRERVLTGLRDYARRNPGPLPASKAYERSVAGHPQWPPARRVLDYHGTMAAAWKAAGATRRRYSRFNTGWTAEDDDYLLAHAGDYTLEIIGRQLGRSAAACKRRLYQHGAGHARDASGYMSASQVAAEYGAPLARVKRLIASGELPAHRVNGGHYWRIAPEDCDRIRHLLAAPKQTHKAVAPDHGDYERRYGLRRQRIGGRMMRVPA